MLAGRQWLGDNTASSTPGFVFLHLGCGASSRLQELPLYPASQGPVLVAAPPSSGWPRTSRSRSDHGKDHAHQSRWDSAVLRIIHVVTARGAEARLLGQVAADVAGNVLPPDDFDAQAKMVMENLHQGAGGRGAKISR